MQIGTGVFKADNTYLRTPVWLTPADLGFKRANNYVTIYLDVFDPQAVLGELTYTFQATNPDNTPSTLPPGMVLDITTGEIAGRVPYQPAVTKEYTFTINAQRFTSIGQELWPADPRTAWPRTKPARNYGAAPVRRRPADESRRPAQHQPVSDGEALPPRAGWP